MTAVEDPLIVSLADDYRDWIFVMGEESASTLLGTTLADLGRDHQWCLKDVIAAINSVVNLHHVMYG